MESRHKGLEIMDIGVCYAPTGSGSYRAPAWTSKQCIHIKNNKIPSTYTYTSRILCKTSLNKR